MKTRFGGYDGKGQILVRNDSELDEAYQLVEKQECVAEQYLDIQKEVSLTVTIGNEQQTTYFPLQENEHQNQILFKTVVPARSDKEMKHVRKLRKSLAQFILWEPLQ